MSRNSQVPPEARIPIALSDPRAIETVHRNLELGSCFFIYSLRRPKEKIRCRVSDGQGARWSWHYWKEAGQSGLERLEPGDILFHSIHLSLNRR